MASDGMSYASHALEQDKTIVEADFSSSEDRVEVLQMCLAADVVVEGFRPGVLTKFGLDYHSLARQNERLVYCSISGFGQDGPDAQTPGHDLTYQVKAGLLSGPGQHSVSLPRHPYADLAGGLTAAMSICAALVKREMTGLGSRLDISITDAARALRAHSYPADAVDPHGPAPLNGDLACYDLYECADGGYVAVAALEPHFFANLCTALELPSLSELDTYITPEVQPHIRQQLSASFKSRTSKEWAFLEDADCCVAVL
jgi:crotonobetainyl-CoA:carnitine CoA-transferase CaiB-like acyl-CoA transferase